MQHNPNRFSAIAAKFGNILVFIASVIVIASYIPHLTQWLDTTLGLNSAFLDPRQSETLWFLGVLSNFRIQMAEASLLLFTLMLGLYFAFLKSSKRRPRALILSGILIVICLAPIFPYYIPCQTPPSTTDSIKILHYNVHNTNQNVTALLHFVEREKPDLISLQEYTAWWQHQIALSKLIQEHYPYHFISPWGEDGIYSKRPLINPQLEWISGSLSGADVSIVTQIKIANRPVTFLFSHTPIPLFPEPYPRQVEHFHFWAKQWEHFPGDFVLIGDMNTTPWTMEFQQFIQKTHLRDSQLGFGLQPSFPSFNAFIRIPIDHCFVSKNIVVKDRHIAPDLGSDHLPVVFRLALKQ